MQADHNLLPHCDVKGKDKGTCHGPEKTLVQVFFGTNTGSVLDSMLADRNLVPHSRLQREAGETCRYRKTCLGLVFNGNEI